MARWKITEDDNLEVDLLGGLDLDAMDLIIDPQWTVKWPGGKFSKPKTIKLQGRS